MLYRVIDAADLPKLVEAFMRSYEVVAPVKRGRGYVFDAVDDASEICVDYPTTISSPKRYLLPPRERLFRFDADANEVAAWEEEIVPRVLFGVHACDINAMNRLDLVFDSERYRDPYYVARRRKTLVVGISCTPNERCFCHLLGADEARFGYDLFLQDLGDRYFVSIDSVEAANILEASCDVRPAEEADRIAFRKITRARQEAFNRDIPDVREIPMLMDAFHKDPFWEEMGSRCLSCTACASVCPTCYCFDIHDELDPDGHGGERVRTWDSCNAPGFAEVAGGHNFRPTNTLRVRHRMYHKLNGFMSKHDHQLCVGCGRCVKACKTNINPIEVLRFFDAKAREGEEA